ncbi:uncharacterized protein KY384_000337 [Bacidia gigantensis]|uniref:uncharacterized protein n=1 Tax=Bacidia gigantensis TaxID=2732470 RepID=UPI001D04F2E1|nr:uncharacterized protein KY384_000337 [Bacidia gigantensis]KAG8526344.1 hypothetical protein KY384_000337 [Bacidia gigantensis]
MHKELLQGSDGLPLGLLSLKQRFSQVQYLASPDFRFGLAGLSPWWKVVAYGLLIVLSTLISLLAGPATALLLIPDVHSNWPAGGASIWLGGSDDALWPSVLSGNATGGTHCTSPTPQMITSGALVNNDCLWAGSIPIGDKFKEAQFASMTDLPINDNLLRRSFGEGFRGFGNVSATGGPETWVSGTHIALGVMMKNAGQVWFQALLSVTSSSKYHALRWRSQGGTAGYGGGKAPVYPYLPEYDVSLNLKLLVQAQAPDISRLNTYWVPAPPSARLTDNTTTTDIPSALLNVFIPPKGTNSSSTLFVCSIDSRWANAGYSGKPIDSFDGHYIQSVTGIHTRNYPSSYPGFEYSHLPVNDGSWRKVRLERDWLEALMPSVDNSSSGSTTLASLLSDIDIGNQSNTIAIPTLEAIIATLVTDGMSRTGFRTILGAPESLQDPLTLLPDESASKWSNFMDGSYSFPRPAGPATEVKWSVTVEGYAYHATSKAFRLSLAVLLLHATLAIGHIIYVFCPRIYRKPFFRNPISCDTWDTMISYIVLAAASDTAPSCTDNENSNTGSYATGASGTKPPSIFENASSGISRYRTLKTQVRIRAKASTLHGINGHSVDVAGPGMPVQAKMFAKAKMLFGLEKEEISRAGGLERIAVDEVYS